MLQWTWGCKYLKTLLSIILDIYPEVGWLGSMVNPFVMFWGPALLFFTAAAPFYIPANSTQWLPFPTSWPTLVFCFSDSGHPDGCEVLICISSVTGDGEHLFMSLFAICMSSFGKCLLKSFAHFWMGLLLSCWVLGVLYIFQISPYQTYDLQISSLLLQVGFLLCC